MILIRADANEFVGSGHIMRCCSIAEELKKLGKEVVFLTADKNGESLISGFDSICLNSVWNKLDDEIQVLSELLADVKPELLLVDSYYVTNRYFDEISPLTRIAYIDDLNSECWNVDYLINYNVFAETMDYSVYDGKQTKVLLDTKYAPLRTEFHRISQHEIKTVSNILVSAGGSDPERVLEKILCDICSLYPELTFHIVIGALNPRLNIIKKLASNNVQLHINEKNMSGLMSDCDIAISASGTTLYELCASGTPTITYTLADNQLAAAKQFDTLGAMINAGDCRSNANFIYKLNGILNRLISDEDKRKDMSIKMNQLVDGKGAYRIAKSIIRT